MDQAVFLTSDCKQVSGVNLYREKWHYTLNVNCKSGFSRMDKWTPRSSKCYWRLTPLFLLAEDLVVLPSDCKGRTVFYFIRGLNRSCYVLHFAVTDNTRIIFVAPYYCSDLLYIHIMNDNHKQWCCAIEPTPAIGVHNTVLPLYTRGNKW